jgi:hypothetical protein
MATEAQRQNARNSQGRNAEQETIGKLSKNARRKLKRYRSFEMVVQQAIDEQLQSGALDRQTQKRRGVETILNSMCDRLIGL